VSGAPIHREGFSRPETTFEKIGYAGSAFLGRLGVAIVLVVAFFAVVVGVPAWRVMGSDSYRAAKMYVANSDPVSMEVGEVLSFEKVPHRYRVSAERAEFKFTVQGAIVSGVAAVTVKQQGGVWAVTSASFGVDRRSIRGPGVHHQNLVLVRGEPEPGPR
jgi:hypothetical protein